MSTDPLERVADALEQARRERDDVHGRADRARLEKQQLQRRLTTSEKKNRELLDRIADLQNRLDLAEQRTEAHQRALNDHAGRT